MTTQTSFYRGGLEGLTPSLWTSRTDDEVLLIGDDGWTFDVDDVSLTDLTLGTNELAAGGYDRLTVTTSTPVWSSPRWSLPSAAFVWPDLGTAEPVYAVVGFEAGVDDTNSVPLWAVYDDEAAALWTCDGTTVTYTVDLRVT